MTSQETDRTSSQAMRDSLPIYRVEPGSAASLDILSSNPISTPRGVPLPTTDLFLQKLLSGEFESRPDDLWIVSYPKTGTTWTSQVMTQLIANGDQDKVMAFIGEMMQKQLERIEILTNTENIEQTVIDNLRTFNSPGPRLIITHLPCEEIPEHVFKVAKVIIPIRNPKDTCVSYYHFHRSNAQLGKYEGIWDKFLDAFVDGEIFWGDFYAYYKTFWTRHKDNPNVYFLHYEEMIADPKAAIKHIAKFLGGSYAEVNDELVQAIADKTSFKTMKKEVGPIFDKYEMLDQKISPFFRKGIKGDWRNHFTVAQNEAFDRHHEAKMADMSDLKFIQ